jgi:16S rRNA (adenine1518-N6/adenine1519-N6)-dimethyltransferase
MTKGYRPKKRLGQNFLRSQAIVGKLVRLIDPRAGERIIEIGPGRGALTVALASSGASVTAVEFDRDLIGRLTKLAEQYSNLEILNQDFLNYEPSPGQFKLVGNIPFNITSPVIDWAVRHRLSITRAYLMVQKELAERVASLPGSRNWSPMAIMTQLHYAINICFDVAASNFRPPPKVVSTVIELAPVEGQPIAHYDFFERLVRASFGHRRKTLINNLVPAFIKDKQAVGGAIASLDLSERVRAEELSTAQFLELTKLLAPFNIS